MFELEDMRERERERERERKSERNSLSFLRVRISPTLNFKL